jgi:hypothetical protein
MSTHRIGPSLATLGLTTALVVVVHMAMLLGGPDALHVSLRPQAISTQTFQTRTLAPAPVSAAHAPIAARHKPKAKAQPQPPPQMAPTVTTGTVAPNTAVAQPVADAEGDETMAPAEASPPPAPPSEPLPPATPPAMTLGVGALPPSAQINYKLTGQERGLTYYASGELRWQHNPTNYEASLTIKAFLVGSRVFSSTGSVGPQGLMPLRHGDKWRGEKATLFDAENHRINFSNNKPSTELQPGAQDQVSLYVQLAAAMGSDPERYKPGSSVSIQTATINDAVPWTLTLQAEETLQMEGKPVATTKWVCLPRGKFDTQVELWLSRAHAWMPVRIRITQVSGSFIDMNMDSIQPLAPLVSPSATN